MVFSRYEVASQVRRRFFFEILINRKGLRMFQEQEQGSATTGQQADKPVRNPYILNFCRVLVDKKGESHQPEALEKLLGNMYTLYEYMLGQNMVSSLPEAAREHYLSLTQDLANLSYEKIGEVFERNIPNYKEVMRDTMKQFAEIFMKNREFNPKDYPVSDGSSQG
jgi:hypothetical protein